jgi:hypothetical protein
MAFFKFIHVTLSSFKFITFKKLSPKSLAALFFYGLNAIKYGTARNRIKIHKNGKTRAKVLPRGLSALFFYGLNAIKRILKRGFLRRGVLPHFYADHAVLEIE